jgi:hypothetical protein
MMSTNTAELARAVAMAALAGQTRMDGVTPAFKHSEDVARQFKDDRMRTIGYLHDIMEDTPVDGFMLGDMGFGNGDIVSVLNHLTRRGSETYFEYIDRVKFNDDAIKVKVADIISNLSDLPTGHHSLRKRWNKALRILLAPKVSTGATKANTLPEYGIDGSDAWLSRWAHPVGLGGGHTFMKIAKANGFAYWTAYGGDVRETHTNGAAGEIVGVWNDLPDA